MRNYPLHVRYQGTVDRESAYEQLRAKADKAVIPLPPASTRKNRVPTFRPVSGDLFGVAAKSAAHAIGSQIGREIIRGRLGSTSGDSG